MVDLYDLGCAADAGARLSKRFAVVLTALFATACTEPGPASHRGLYVWGPEVEVLIPCGSNEPHWVRTTNRLGDQLSSAHEQGRTEPYQGIYVEVEGFYSGPPSEDRDGSFGEEYDETFTITGVSLIQREPLPDCVISR
jgi:hypothetical protein